MKYYAFISYNSKDIRWGKRLQRKLENFCLPATICKNRGWSKRPFRPIFFAPTDIQPGGLSEELRKRLEDSIHLIVICSPNSARSRWVGEEIAFFHSLGRDDKIHFFIVDGEPGSEDPEKECFNPIVSTLGIPEILGANIQERIYRFPWLNRERAYVQLITKLLGIEFDEIWQRHKRRLRWKVAFYLAGAMAVFLITITVGEMSKPVSISFSLEEGSVHNEFLPPLKDATVSLTLADGTCEKEVLPSLDKRVTFRNIPHRFLGKEADIQVDCPDFLPIRERRVLTQEMRLPIMRNPEAYGRIRHVLWSPDREEYGANVTIMIDNMKLVSSEKGEINVDVPLEYQRKQYHLSADIPLIDTLISATHIKGKTVIRIY